MSAPAPPASIADEWDLSLTQTETALELPFFTIETVNAVYSHRETLPVAEYATPAIDVAPRAVFTSALSFSQSLPDLGVDPANPHVFRVGCTYARREFAESVREDGLQQVSRTGDRHLERERGPDGRAYRYEAAHPFDANALLEETASGEILVATTVWAAIWPTENSYAMAGGIFPTEDLPAAVERQVPGGTLGADVRLDPNPDSDRERLFALLSTVEP